MIPSVVAETTNQTYAYCLDHWYDFTKTQPGSRWTPEQLEFSILSFINEYSKQQKSVATISQHIAALTHKYGATVRSEKVRQALQRYARERGRPAKKATSIGVEQLTAMVQSVAIDAEKFVDRVWRNRALLTVGWSAALRASELTSIRRSHLEHVDEGFVLTIPRSKTDQTGKGRQIPLPYFHIAHALICPARNLEAYLTKQLDLFDNRDSDFYIFPIAMRTVSRVVKAYAKKAGFHGAYSSHSLRRGLATTAARHGVDDRTIMRHGRWTTREVVDGYVDEGTLWSRTALDFLR